MISIVSIGVTLFFVTVAPVFSQAEPSSWTNHVVNGSFELPVLATGANYVVPASELAPWETTQPAFLVWVSPLPNEQAADGRQHIEVVTAWQTVTITPGEDYQFSFQHSPRPGVDSPLTVTMDGNIIATFAENGTALAGFQWKRYATNFTAVSNTMTIRFNGHGVWGSTHIDGVTVERLPLRSAIRVSEMEISWESVTDKRYQVQFRSVATANLWTDLGVSVQGTGTMNLLKDPVPLDEPRRFYRVITVP